MMFLFPAAEWFSWHPEYVMMYLLWLYLVWALCRRVLGPMLLEKKRIFLVIGSFFLIATVTFLMTLTRVDFPQAQDSMSMPLHQRAMWILLLAVISEGLPVGMLSAINKNLKAAKEEDEHEINVGKAIDTRKAEALPGDDNLQLKSGYKKVYVPVSAIKYIEGRNNYACVHLDNMEDVISQIPLKDVMDMLPEGKFVRIQRSYIVPVWRIESATAAQVKLMGIETPLPVGRAYKDVLKNITK